MMDVVLLLITLVVESVLFFLNFVNAFHIRNVSK